VTPTCAAARVHTHSMTVTVSFTYSQRRITVGQASLACVHSLASVSSLACRGRVSLHALLLGAASTFTYNYQPLDTSSMGSPLASCFLGAEGLAPLKRLL
jgi:hypothetical protein